MRLRCICNDRLLGLPSPLSRPLGARERRERAASGEGRGAHTWEVKSCCWSWRPSRRSQERTVLSRPPVHSLVPSWEMSMQLAPSVWPWNCLWKPSGEKGVSPKGPLSAEQAAVQGGQASSICAKGETEAQKGVLR